MLRSTTAVPGPYPEDVFQPTASVRSATQTPLIAGPLQGIQVTVHKLDTLDNSIFFKPFLVNYSTSIPIAWIRNIDKFDPIRF